MKPTGLTNYLPLLLALILYSCSHLENARINKIEHFYVSAENSEEFFSFLTEQCELPIVWEYQNWGDFSSGGVTLGNVVLELIDSKSSQAPNRYGIALEPSHSMKHMQAALEVKEVDFGEVSKASAWSTASLLNALPDDINLFICDYFDRKTVLNNLTEQPTRQEFLKFQ